MKNILLFTCCILSIAAYGQQWTWAKIIPSAVPTVNFEKICVDKNGNVYVAGNEYDYQSAARTKVVLCKFSSAGTLLRSDTIKATNNPCWVTGLLLDKVGNIYLGVNFGGTISIADTLIYGRGEGDFIIAKFSPAGALIWINNEGGLKDDMSSDLRFDNNQHLFCAGTFQKQAYFGNDSLLFARGNKDLFIAEYDTSGKLLWFKNAWNTDTNYADNGATSELISFDNDNNILLSGHFNGNLVLDSIVFNYEGQYGTRFLARIDSKRKFIWALVPDHYTVNATGLEAANSNYFFVADLGCWTPGCWTTFIKYDYSGNVLWDTSYSGNYPIACYVNKIALKNNSLYAFGKQEMNYDHDCCSDYYHLTLVRYDSLNSLLWMDTTVSNKYLSGFGIAVDDSENVYVTGTFQDTVIFGNSILISNNQQSIYVAKLSQHSMPYIVKSHCLNNGVRLYPNPSTGTVIVDLPYSTSSNLSVYDVFGNCLLKKSCHNETRIDLNCQPKGIYFMEIVSGGERVVKKIVLE